MTLAAIIVFIIGYLAIAFEHPLKLNKAAAALLTAVFCWLLYILSVVDKEHAVEELRDYLGKISGIIFFLLGAMTIVELIDSHNGFALIAERIKTRSKLKLLWIISFITFFLSSILDNLTTAIVMTSLVAKMLNNKEDRFWFAGVIIIAANAGGAFSPLGDVTTTMLWIGGQITAQNVLLKLFLPSLFVCLIPALIISPRFRNQTFSFHDSIDASGNKSDAKIVLTAGIGLLLFVPVFKILTHLPPFMGMLFALGVFWVLVSILHLNKPHHLKYKLTVTHALEKVDTPSILFFLGILLAISAVESFGLLKALAEFFNNTLGNIYSIGTAMGLISAIIDNVPLVAAAQGMYDLTSFPADHPLWEFLALTTGTGGSCIIIGSAAGVAAMGIEKISFTWYLKKVSWIAFAGFISGILIFILQNKIFR